MKAREPDSCRRYLCATNTETRPNAEGIPVPQRESDPSSNRKLEAVYDWYRNPQISKCPICSRPKGSPCKLYSVNQSGYQPIRTARKDGQDNCPLDRPLTAIEVGSAPMMENRNEDPEGSEEMAEQQI